MSIPFGLSVHHFISSVGADAGFAALIGLALLILLYFSHARETATLRARADEAALRVQELEAELADLADQVAALPAEISVRAASPRVTAAYGGVQAQQPGAPVTSALPPAAPAGVAAPALAAATRLIPMPDPPPLPEYEPVTVAGGAGPGGGGGNGAGGATSTSRPVVAAAAATMQRPVQAPTGGAARPGVPPVRPGAGPGPGSGRVGGGPPRGGGPARPSGAPRSAVPVRPAPRRSRAGRILAAVLVALIAAGAVVAGVVLLTHRSHAPAAKSSVHGTLASRRTSSSGALRPSAITVSVLNGTDQSGLAAHVLQRLTGDGYRKGTYSNAADQTHTTTLVEYMAPADRSDALAVAATLKLPATSVQPIDPTTKAIACPPAQACTSAVVVTAGRDLAAQ